MIVECPAESRGIRTKRELNAAEVVANHEFSLLKGRVLRSKTGCATAIVPRHMSHGYQALFCYDSNNICGSVSNLLSGLCCMGSPELPTFMADR